MITPQDDLAEPDLDAAHDLADRIGTLVSGNACDIVLLALSLSTAAVMTNASDGDYVLDANGFAAAVVNTHAGLDHPLTGEKPDLFDALRLLMCGLIQHYPTNKVISVWLSALLEVLVQAGVEKAQGVLRDTADALPATVKALEALNAMDAGGNTGQVGRA